MANKSPIEWTESTWNPVTGCTKISTGCAHCYAERMAYRLQAMGQPNYRNGFDVTIHEHALDIPLRWKSSQMIFVNSMSDLFHKDVPSKFIHKVFSTMNRADWHTYQVLTKRAGRFAQLQGSLAWASHIWMGVTVENANHIDRIDYLRYSNAQVKFLSLEPLLGPIPKLNLSGIDWVIVGGESGPGARPMQESWVLDIKDQCLSSGVSFFFKQWGGVQKKKAGRLLEGRTWDQMPVSLVS
ncbi:MAG: phage Gp37/Gp68 family protein [Lentisphaerae bacterium]|nr:phage Gp37/Gp68 family protein [Lentisphaerota bacterium]